VETGQVIAIVDDKLTLAAESPEQAVVEAEVARDGFEAWYRNPGSATPASLRIAYQNDEDVWASLQPDFIVVSRRSDGALGASIVDPHGDYLADARAKLQALAAFFVRRRRFFAPLLAIVKDEMIQTAWAAS